MKHKKRILVSWVARNNDFIKLVDGRLEVNPKGTHVNFYNNENISGNYERHLLLYTPTDDELEENAYRRLYEYLQRSFLDIILMKIPISDVLSVAEIQRECYDLLSLYNNAEIDIFISPGTPAMQTAWYLTAISMVNVSLFQVRPPQYRKPSITDIKEYIEITKDDTPKFLNILEKYRSSKEEKEPVNFPSLLQVYKDAEKVAVTNKVTALIQGETGTGKELLARHIHQCSTRKNGPFVAINCASIGDDLLESRLFGYKQGSFTGALKDTKGAFEEADIGTIFLDEIGDVSPKMQQSLLRVLQESVICKIGSFKEVKINVRVIAASHKNLPDLVESGKFRADLYYRLAVAELEIPSLKEYKEEERKRMIGYFLKTKSQIFGRNPISLSKEVENHLLSYPFPGNIRELENLIERLYTFVEDTVKMEDLPKRIRFPEGVSSSLKLEDIEKQHIRKVLVMTSGSKTKSAGILGVAYGTLVKKIKDYHLHHYL
ncbi:sigma-54 interaction domain-containing protein [Chryseobacterium sp. SL1]|uniref:sigma-54 interaction domain-containing protein n=1 Tax=Chryseobacterium sp. SL1 TaxID=2995159 RepID=UPI0022726F90|nr:sigma-54 dependent transcriptional regulator [Chryseobacterium sp. SL1]MCY1660125.1 sigma-54 dependent transcriptional regulator [Chryseobacterium sp. SL1]